MSLEKINLHGRLTTRELDTLGKRLHDDGKFGCDYAPLSKDAKIDFIWKEAHRIYDKHGADAAGQMIELLTMGIENDRIEGGADDPDALKYGKDAGATQSLGANTEGPPPIDVGSKPFKYQPSEIDNAPKCEDATCNLHAGPDSGGTCKQFGAGACEECEAPYRNSPFHAGNDPDTGEPKCSVERKLREFHNHSQGQGDGQQGDGQGEGGSPQPLCECIDPMILIEIIKQVSHGEFDPKFKAVGKTFEDIEKAITMLAQAYSQGQEASNALKAELLAAMKTLKEVKRRKVATAEKVIFAYPNVPEVEVGTGMMYHPITFPQVLALMCLPDELRQPVLLFGEAGAGKSTLWEQIAMALQLFEEDYSAISMSGDTMSGKIVGRILPIAQGVYVPSELVRRLLLKRPFLFVFDEYDAPSPEIQVGLHTFLANNAIYVEERSFAQEDVRIPKPPGTRIGAACNTNLAGGTGRYQGRQAQDGATRDRWICLKMVENPAIAASICGVPYEPLPLWVPQQYSEAELRDELRQAHEWYKTTQAMIEAKRTPQLLTPRAMLRARAMLTAGFTWLEARRALYAGWKADEMDQVGEKEITAY